MGVFTSALFTLPMDVANRIVAPLHWDTHFFNFLKYEKYFFYFLILGVSAHSLTLVFLTVSDITCTEKGIADQFKEGTPELRDLNSYVDLLCSSEVKWRHVYAFIIEIAIICIFFGYGLFLKSVMWNIKLNYYLYHGRHEDIPEFKELIIKVDKKTRYAKKLKIDFCWYFLVKLIGFIILSGIIITLLVLKYTLPEAKDLFLPYANECGPELRWDDEIIGEYYCHYENEWTIYLINICTDVYSICLLAISAIQVVYLIIISICFCCIKGSFIDAMDKDESLILALLEWLKEKLTCCCCNKKTASCPTCGQTYIPLPIEEERERKKSVSEATHDDLY